ncbi:MAG: hypothetical protein Kow0042_10620 [Calditrichia bacterium]
MKRRTVVLFSLILLFPLLIFAQYTQQSPTGGMVDWTNQVIREIGIGSPNPNMPIAAQRAGAIEAAKRVALRNLLERVQGMNITSEVTIEQYMVTNDVIRNRIEGTIKNFRVVDTRYKSDGSVEVEVEVPLSGLYEVILPDQIPEGVVPGQQMPGQPGNVVYTGLIVDARGLGLRPALAPKILDENGQEVYGTGRVSRDYALQIGVVGYEKDLTRARANERVTNNPIVVKALQVSGTHKTDVVISNQDAQLIRSAGQNLNFLQQCKVMLVLD